MANWLGCCIEQIFLGLCSLVNLFCPNDKNFMVQVWEWYSERVCICEFCLSLLFNKIKPFSSFKHFIKCTSHFSENQPYFYKTHKDLFISYWNTQWLIIHVWKKIVLHFVSGFCLFLVYGNFVWKWCWNSRMQLLFLSLSW